MPTATRESRIAAQMTWYFPGTPADVRRQWAAAEIDRQDRDAADARRVAEWRGTQAGMQEMFS